MTPERIKQLTPDGYGGDFEMTMQSERSAPTRCDVCGKFRKQEDLSGMCGEDEEWVECGWCMSEYDYERHYGKKREPTMEVGA